MESQSTPKQQVAEQLKNASSIMVTTAKNPSVDEVASAIGLTHMLQSMNKHATAVISTTLPAVLSFLNPEEMVETTTDRLRDFVITFSKEKADKLRYKVIDEDVKIFITPYKTILSKDDLTFTQGDYNIDTVVILGATKRNELDDAVLQHSRIMSDSTVVTINAGDKVPSVGSINWHEPEASSVAEMLVSMSEALASGLLNKSSSQALLAGLVSATGQFGNKNTTPKVMTMAAQLMAAGADQQQIVNAFESQKKSQFSQSETTPDLPTSIKENPSESNIKFDHDETNATTTESSKKDDDQSGSEVDTPIESPRPITNPNPALNNTASDQDLQKLVDDLQSTTSNQSHSEPSVSVTPPANDRIVLDGGTDQGQSGLSPAIQTDTRERLANKPHVDIDNPILSQPATSDTSQPVLNAHDHSQDAKPESTPPEEEIMKHGGTSTPAETSYPPLGDIPSPDQTHTSEPHINVHPETPVLESPKPAPQDKTLATSNTPAAQSVANAQPKASAEHNNDALSAAREAVARAADSQEPSLPKPIESISAHDMQATDEGIKIDHNGNIQAQ